MKRFFIVSVKNQTTTFVKQAVEKARILLEKVLDFIDLILSQMKKGAKNLLDELSKILDEVFAGGKKQTIYLIILSRKGNLLKQKKRIRGKSLEAKTSLDTRRDFRVV